MSFKKQQRQKVILTFSHPSPLKEVMRPSPYLEERITLVPRYTGLVSLPQPTVHPSDPLSPHLSTTTHSPSNFI